MKRKWELLLGMIGGSLSLIFFGGLAVTLSNMSASEFKKLSVACCRSSSFVFRKYI